MARKTDLIWDTLVLLFGIPLSPAEKSRRGKRVRELRQMATELGLDDEEMCVEIRKHQKRMHSCWNEKYVSENTLVNYWSRFNADLTADRVVDAAGWEPAAADLKRKEL